MGEFPFKAILTVVTFTGIVVTALPAISRDLRRVDRNTLLAVFDFPPERTEDAEARGGIGPAVANARLIDPAGDLAYFYDALELTERRTAGAITRIVHYGDSPTTADMITGDVRDMLQRRFGDAGHGFSLVAKPWEWYEHRGVGVRGGG